MEIRDPVHGSIHILDEEVPVLEHPFFQRLRNIKQLGLSEIVFPGATHTRYLHSIGVMYISSKVFDSLFKDRLQNKEFLRLKETLRLACLLHDIGHAPLSHTTEYVMPSVEELKLPKRFLGDDEFQATHEHYTIKAIVDSSFTDSFKKVRQNFGVTPEAIAELVLGHTTEENYFIIDGVNYFPLLHQLVSSEMDCDRMDYLLRDSYFCGVSYGHYDLDWLIDNLKVCTIESVASLGISERAISTFDDFLLSRFHMFIMVYFHYKAVCLEQILYNYFENSNSEYTIPADIEAYQKHDDYFLRKVLKGSKNEWAKKVVNNHIPQKIFETFGDQNLTKLDQLESYLKEQDIHFIKCSSKGRLSKYYSNSQRDHEQTHPLKVVRLYPSSGHQLYININEATNLYDRYSQSHAVNRIHCEMGELSESQKKQIQTIIKN